MNSDQIHDEDAALVRRALFLTGPTASGKSAVGIALAKRLNAELISLDSMALYRGMDIGTAKPSVAEQAEVPHHLLDVLDIWEAATVAFYRARALEAARAIEARGRVPLFVGGTALYLKAMLRGLFDGPASDEGLRAELEAIANREGGAALHDRLREIDPRAAARLHPNDIRRVVRALEVARLTNKPISDWQLEHAQPAQGVCVIALARDRDDLQSRIDSRIDHMFSCGFIEEVRRLRDAGRPMHRNPSQAVGYREVLSMLEGAVSLDEALAAIRARTKRFAKHQETWFRNLAEVQRLEVGPQETVEAIADRFTDASHHARN